MKNLIFLACALCAVQAVPVPAEQPNELEILQIPLQGNKVCAKIVFTFIWIITSFSILFFPNQIILVAA